MESGAVLTTARLTLRPFTADDVDGLHHIVNAPDVLRYFPMTPPLARHQVDRMVAQMAAHWQYRDFGLWALESRADGKLIGRCGLQYLPELDEVEIDFILDPAFWGRGLATEAGQAALTYGFTVLDLDTVVGIVHVENGASQRVLVKLGLRRVRQATFFGMPCYQYEIRREDG